LTDADRAKQAQLHIIRTDNRFTNADLQAIDHYRAPLAAEARTYELTGFTPENDAARFSFDEWTRNDFALLLSGAVIPYEQAPDRIAKQQRLIEDVRTLYRKDDLTSLSPLGEVESLALPGQSYKLALTPGVIASAFRRARDGQSDEELLPDPAPLLEGKGADQGGYVAIDGNWWVPSGLAFFDPDADATDPVSTAARELGTARQHFFLPRKMVDPFGHRSIVEYDPHDLLLVRTVDALGNTTSAVDDYRVLQPVLVTDPNRNRAVAAFDALGMMVATAVMGKEGEKLGDLLEGFDADPALADLQAFVVDPQAAAPSLLGKATTRFVYDLDRFQRTGQPAFAAALMRETHFHDPGGTSTRIQIGFSYSDGFGREIQKKNQAEEGDAPQRQAPQPLPGGDVRPGELVRDAQGNLVQSDTPQRWIGSGRTVFNNKGKPVKQYEPFFSSTHLYEPERDLTDTGVSPVLFYDPAGRVIATLHPNHTYEKVVFDAWAQASYDANDTVAANGTQTGDPRTDPDIAGFVHAYFQSQPPTWQTWYVQRIDNQLGPAEREAARKAAAHANTPIAAHFDALGRTFMAVAHNRFSRHGVLIEESNATRFDLDIESNQRAVSDAEGRVVIRYDYNILGARIHQTSMDAGERWSLSDVAGTPIRTFDSRGFERRLTYDALRRPTGLFVTESGAERLAERTVYGESQGDIRNQRTRVYQLFDAAGVVTQEAYDFKGNVLDSRRDLLPDFKQMVDWLQEPTASDGTFTNHTTYDALNRSLTTTSPDGSIYRPTFNVAKLLDRVDVNLRGAAIVTSFVTNIDYDAKGQRTLIAYANGAVTTYDYDPLTFRLIQLRTTRPSVSDVTASQLFNNCSVIQDLSYTYDPVGNLTSVEDSAVKTTFYGNQQVDPISHYTYDALYRLIEAQGREHIGQTAFDFDPIDGNFRDYPFAGIRVNSNDLQALRNYTEQYEYDRVGNFQILRHAAAGGSWTRQYEYQEISSLERDQKNNQLSRTIVGNGLTRTEPYSYDAHGNVTSMPQLAAMGWDFKDEFRLADLGGGGTAFYVYDVAGQRVRKVIESRSGVRRKERIYLGVFEIYREYDGSGSAITLERESLHVLDDQRRIVLVETKTIEDGRSVAVPAPSQRYQFDNHMRSSSVELTEDGELISYEEYHPYGTTAFQAGRSAVEVSPKRYRYTGKERDDETGLNYHGARYYAPWLGRWVSCDPLDTIDSLNLYQYAKLNPCTFSDPSGTNVDPNLFIDNPDADPTVIGGALQFRAPSGKFATIHDEPLLFADASVPDAPKLPPKPPVPPKPKPEQKPATPSSPSPAPKKDAPTEDYGTSGPTTAQKIGAFAKGAAEGLATGIAIEAGVGFVGGLGIAGLTASTLGIGLLVVGVIAIAYHWDDITATASRLYEGKGTLADYEAAGGVAGGLLSIGASGPAGEVGAELGQATRALGEDLLKGGQRLATAGGGALDDTVLMSKGSGGTGGGGRGQYKPPVRDSTGKVHGEFGKELPKGGAAVRRALDSWSREELEAAAEELEASIAARQAEQRMLGETSVSETGSPTGAAHRVRIDQELDLLRAIRKRLGGS
jgi:RHS repeat-associated protein